jgi:hypothetical protein
MVLSLTWRLKMDHLKAFLYVMTTEADTLTMSDVDTWWKRHGLLLTLSGAFHKEIKSFKEMSLGTA